MEILRVEMHRLLINLYLPFNLETLPVKAFNLERDFYPVQLKKQEPGCKKVENRCFILQEPTNIDVALRNNYDSELRHYPHYVAQMKRRIHNEQILNTRIALTEICFGNKSDHTYFTTIVETN